MNLLKAFDDLLIERASYVILLERFALLKDQFALKDQKLAELNEELAQARAENTELQHRIKRQENQILEYSKTEQFTEERGASFKRRPDGSFHNAVYCPKCHISVPPFPPGCEFSCNCGWASSFIESELPGILAKLK